MKFSNHFLSCIKAILPAVAITCATLSATAQINDLPRVAPESVGISSKVIAQLFRLSNESQGHRDTQRAAYAPRQSYW